MAREPIDRLREEILQVINAYGREHELSWYTILGMIEIVKNDILLSSMMAEKDDS